METMEITAKDLAKDWFDRDSTYVKIRKDGRIRWEDTLNEKGVYSSYLLEAPSLEFLIKRAYSLAKETIISMNLPFKVHIKISSSEVSGATNGATIYLSTSIFDDKKISNGNKLDVFLGTVIHEGCHLLYTDFGALKRIRGRDDLESRMIHTIANIIEDERVEQCLGEDKPGLARFLEKTKYYYFDLYEQKVNRKEFVVSDFDELMDCLLHIIRYPKYVKEEQLDKFIFAFIKIKELLTPFPENTEKVVEASCQIYRIFEEFLEKQPETKSDKPAISTSGKNANGDDADTDENGSAGEDESGKDTEIKTSAKKADPADASKIGDTFQGSKSLGIPSSLPIMEKLFDVKSSKSPEDANDGLSPFEVSLAVSRANDLLGRLCEGEVENGTDERVFFEKPKPVKEIYKISLDRVKRYIPVISRALKGHCKEYKLVHRSMRSGVIDTNKLAEAVQGVPTVYIRGGNVKTDKVSLCVLIDQSGSMNIVDRIGAARDMAVLLNEAIGHIPNVELFIYGHSADISHGGDTNIFVYREKDYAPMYALGAVKAVQENRDGVAIYEVANRVRKQTDNNVLFFILSDGAPCAQGYIGSLAREHVRESVSRVEKMGFNVVQICINARDYAPSSMFKNYIIVNDLQHLASKIGNVIKKAIINKTKTHICGV